MPRPPDHVLAVLVVAARVHDLADVVQERRDLEQHALVVGHAVDVAELVEQRARELAHVLAVRGVVIDAVRERARRGEQRLVVRALGPLLLLARRLGELEQHRLADADARRHQPRDPELARRRREHERGDADHLGAVALDAVALHPLLDGGADDRRQRLLERRELEAGGVRPRRRRRARRGSSRAPRRCRRSPPRRRPARPRRPRPRARSSASASPCSAAPCRPRRRRSRRRARTSRAAAPCRRAASTRATPSPGAG